MSSVKNILGEALQPCSHDPVTGFFRDGCCHTHAEDQGLHVVCAQLSAEFLDYTRTQGNDLSTPRPAFGFPGLKPGDQWCLCAGRWWEAYQAGKAPPVVLSATHERALEVIPLEVLKRCAVDLN